MVAIASLLKRAGAALSRGRFAEAVADCEAVLNVEPRSAEAHYMLGVGRGGGGDLEGALSSFDAALEVRPGFVQVLAQKARTLVELNRRVEASAACDDVLKLAPGDAYSINTIGVVLGRLGRHAASADLFQRAAEKAGTPGAWYNLAAARQFLGEFDAARTAYRACLARAPQHGRAWSGLVQITKQTPEANEVERLEAMFAQVKDNPDGRLEVGHALAKACEDLGEQGKAMAWLAEAKFLAAAAVRDSEGRDEAVFDAAHALLGVEPAAGASDASPIFVCGLPRTGTTLVERILSGHSMVGSAGELSDLPIAVNAAVGAATEHLFEPETLARASDRDAGAIGRAYVESVRDVLGIEGRFVDKLPFNFLLAPLVLAGLPDARVIVLRRHPADSVLANYRQIFSRSARYLDYTYDLERGARYYVRFDALMTAFRARLPSDRFIEVAYEDIVADVEGQVRRLLDLCGLSFEQACVDFHENETPIATASAAQARLPIYSSSVGRWRACRPAIDPALRILVDAGLMSEADASG